MRLLHIAESTWGGCGTYLNEIVPLQAESTGAEQVRCLVPMQHVSHLVDVAPEMIWTFDRPDRLGGVPRLAIAIRAAVRLWKPDVIHAHSTFAGAVVRMLTCVQTMPPIIYCPHGWAFEIEQSPATKFATCFAERMLSYRTRRIIAISEAEKSQGERAGIRKSKFVVVPNGIQGKCPEERAAWDDQRLKVLFVGRLDRQKGVDVLFAATRDLGASLSVRIIGEEVLSGRTSQEPRETVGHIAFLGWRSKADVVAQINACDVVVMPSRWEGFGLVAVEAMRAGKPVIASSVGGLREIIEDGVTGLLVAPDDPMALTTALTRCDSSTLQRMGTAGRQRFLAHYTSDRTHAGLMQVYADVLAAGSILPNAPVSHRIEKVAVK